MPDQSTMDEQPAEHCQVLIVGGSLVGLSTAVFLADRGIRPLLVERHSDTSIYARAWGVNPRTMELYRSVGLEAQVRAAQRRLDGTAQRSGILRAESLAGEEHEWFDAPYVHGVFEDSSAVSPTGWSPCPQDKLEPILRARAEELGADLRFSTELRDFTQDDDGVTAQLHDRRTGQTRTVRADYLVGCDGNGSFVRRHLGIGTTGVGTMVHNLAILFDADLTEAVRGRGFMHCQVMNEHVMGVLGTDGERWQLDALYFPDNGDEVDDFTEERCVELVRAAVGVPDLAVRILGRLPWELAARLADTFTAGRVFLAGDAAHVHPPTGGFGANTGVQDAHNLAWKLAYVLTGRAGTALLDTYEAERRPVSAFTVDQAVARSLQRFRNPAVADVQAAPIVDDLTVMMGYRYRSAAVVAEPGEAPPPAGGAGGYGDGYADDCDDPAKPTGRPGTRAAHVALTRDDTKLSTLDLLGPDLTLLYQVSSKDQASGEHDAAGEWSAAAERVSAALGVTVTVQPIGDGTSDDGDAFGQAYGITPPAAALVRPDGFLAWRGNDPRTLDAVIRHVLQQHSLHQHGLQEHGLQQHSLHQQHGLHRGGTPS